MDRWNQQNYVTWWLSRGFFWWTTGWVNSQTVQVTVVNKWMTTTEILGEVRGNAVPAINHEPHCSCKLMFSCGVYLWHLITHSDLVSKDSEVVLRFSTMSHFYLRQSDWHQHVHRCAVEEARRFLILDIYCSIPRDYDVGTYCI